MFIFYCLTWVWMFFHFLFASFSLVNKVQAFASAVVSGPLHTPQLPQVPTWLPTQHPHYQPAHPRVCLLRKVIRPREGKTNIQHAVKAERCTHTHTHANSVNGPGTFSVCNPVQSRCKSFLSVVKVCGRHAQHVAGRFGGPRMDSGCSRLWSTPMRMAFTSKTNCRNAGWKRAGLRERESSRERAHDRERVLPGGGGCLFSWFGREL